MRGEDAFAVLGLRPGAERSEIDQAYRRLIKRYHPDFADGDSARAAELNRAYALLRGRGRDSAREWPGPLAPIVPARAYAAQPGRRRGTMTGVVAIIAAVGIALGATMKMDNGRPLVDLPTPQFGADNEPRALGSRADLDEPLAAELIELSVEDAVRLYGDGDSRGAAEFSRNCLRRMNSGPSVPLFDSCAAYDEAITILTASDPKFDSGAFHPSAVTARQVSAARMLSADYFDAESRLQRIRTSVQMMLLPEMPQVLERRIRAAEPVEPPPRLVAAPPEPTIVAPPPPQPRIASRSLPAAVQKGSGAVRRSLARAASLPAPARRTPAQRASSTQIERASAPKAEPAPRTAPREAPAWQKPIRPAWQRPLPPASQ